MKLQIRYRDNLQQAIHAACIKGNDPLIWLTEIDRWNIPADELECYLLPLSIQSVEASGLFVIFKDPAKANKIDLQDPYACIEHRLFIPCHAEIIPQVSRNELNEMLLWNKQVFHPVIGLIGFESKDQIILSDLFAYDEPLAGDWSFAHPGIDTKPLLNEIIIIRPTAEELINSIKKEIGQKPLEDIPKKKGESSAIGKAVDKIKFGLFKGLYKTLQLFTKSPSEGNNISSGNEGLVQKFQNWLVHNIDELQKKRDYEIKRLLNLFDEDSNEALQYAIPLNSPYLNRGSQTSSSRLTRNPLQFNLGRLGGGELVDAWDLGSHYQDLRTKYLNAARKEIEKKDFKKAAYVYAHLLGDYNSAANTLEQGKMYREAAALYKDHLKNTAAAAECLERGKLYLEAIELNKELHKDEKVGDLYKLVSQDENAGVYYEKHIVTKLSHNDHLDAARVIDEKLNERERAQQVLLQGWDHSYQHELCLKKYFDILLDTHPDTATAKVKQIFEKNTPRYKRMPLLNVLEHIKKKKDDDDLAQTTQNIVYQIVHEEANIGNTQAVHSLKKFLPGDKLISSDTSRFVNSNQLKPARSLNSGVFYLDQSIKWIKAVPHRNQFLAVGIKDSCLHMVRGNWYGNFEYYSWTNPVKLYTRFTFINSPYQSNHVILHSSDGVPVTRKNLPKNKYFTEALVVYCPVWLHKGLAQFIIDGENAVSRLVIENNELTLHHYTLDGNLKSSVNCSFGKESPPFLGNVFSNPILAYHDGFYYTYKEKYFISVSHKGQANAAEFNTIIRFFTASGSLVDFRLIVSTNKGCLLYKPAAGNLNMQGGFFAEQLIPTSISFLQSDRFVIAEKQKAFLFEIRDEIPNMVREYHTHSPIVAVLPGAARYQFALLEESGKLTVCDIDT